MKFDYKNILIMGYGKSGQAVEDVLKKLNGVNYYIYDKAKGISGGKYLSKLTKKIVDNFDLIVVSPGVSIYNKYIVYAEKVGIKVVGELEFGYWFTTAPIIAITGTNGKTTTTSLTNNIVGTTYKSGAYGNIGLPLSTAYNKECDYIVCEVSSFQLETTNLFTPYISCILNIGEDHLDRHRTLENYINCKISLLKNCTEKSIVVLNADDSILMSKTENIRCRKFYISQTKKVKGVYIYNDCVYVNLKSPTKICSLEEIEKGYGILGDILASILIGILLKIETTKILDVVKSFSISPHRMQLVANKDGVRFIDDSKSTNVHSSLNALRCVNDRVILMLGGYNKKLSFNRVFAEYSDKLEFVVAFGDTRKKVLMSAKKFGFDRIKIFKSFKDATYFACSIAKENSAVLLSPACSSFDEFSSYAERGEVFNQIVKDFVNAKN